MATWIFFFHLLFPTPAESAPDLSAVKVGDLPYRGAEAFFAKFEREAEDEERRARAEG